MNGKLCETLAAIYLRFHGYKIIDRNYHSRFGEIDLIAKNKGVIVFVEVKARGKNAFYAPAYAVDFYKQRKIVKTAEFYISRNNLFDTDVRFDVIEIRKKRILLSFNHIIDAFGV